MAVSSTRGRRVRRKEKKGLFAHLKNLGFTNRLALYIMVFLAAGLAGGFYLAVKSIATAENTSADGEGIKYAAAKANRFVANTSDLGSVDSPSI